MRYAVTLLPHWVFEGEVVALTLHTGRQIKTTRIHQFAYTHQVVDEALRGAIGRTGPAEGNNTILPLIVLHANDKRIDRPIKGLT